jgi:trimeric autotransporter adhesin
MKSASILLLAVLSFSAQLVGQSFQGSLRGRVTDPKGAATPLAKVTLTNDATNVTRTTITSGEGEYDFFAVNPATYTVTVEAAGFKRLEQKRVVVSTQANVTLDLSLEVGQVSESVNVTAEAPPLSTQPITKNKA